MNSAKFRTELINIMPGYTWIVHRPPDGIKNSLRATGIQSVGFNRLSTLQVFKREINGIIDYEVKSAGFGGNAPWLSTCTDETLARALRGLQNHYDAVAMNYSNHASYLEGARKKHQKSDG